MRAVAGLAVLGLMGLAVAPRQAAADSPQPKLVVVPAQGKGGPNLKSQIGSYIEKPLKQSAAVISFDKYSKAAKAAGVRPKSVTGPEAVIPASRGVGATHVLIVESVADKVGEGKKKKTAYFASITLIDAVTGETLLSKRYPLPNKKLTAAQGSEVVGDVVPKLVPKASPPAPAPEPPPPPPPTAPDAPTPLPTHAPAPAAPSPPAPAPSDGTVAQDGNQEPPVAEGSPSEGSPTDAPSDAPPAEPPAKRRDSWRPGFRLAVGGSGYFRTGTLTTDNATDKPPCYCEHPGVAAPMFGRGIAQFELYPLAIMGVGDWWEGFGLHGEGHFGVVKTNLGGGVITSSNVSGLAGGLQYRHVFWESLTAIDLQVRAGFARFNFPLSGTQFPGVDYRSPYGGLVLTVPLVDPLALVVGGNLYFRLLNLPTTSVLGIQTNAGLGWDVHVAARLKVIDFLEFQAQGWVQQYTVPYDSRSQTSLVGANPQYQGVTLKDSIYGFTLTAGFSL